MASAAATKRGKEATSQACTFSDLPLEAMDAVLSFLDVKSLGRMESTSRLCRQVAGKLWRVQCLAAFGLREPQPFLSLADIPAASGGGTDTWKLIVRDALVQRSLQWPCNCAQGSAQPQHKALVVSASMETDSRGELSLGTTDYGDNTLQLQSSISLGGDRCGRAVTAWPWINPRSNLVCSGEQPDCSLPMTNRVKLASSSSIAPEDPAHDCYQLVRRNFHYFEVRIMQGDLRSAPAAANESEHCISVGFGTSGFRTNGKQPGWDYNSFGYHGDDGCIYWGSGEAQSWGPSFSAGDTVGCGLDCGLRAVWYTLNGRFLGVAHEGCAVRRAHYRPIVGVDSLDRVEVNLQGPWMFDIRCYAKHRRDAATIWWKSTLGENRQLLLSTEKAACDALGLDSPDTAHAQRASMVDQLDSWARTERVQLFTGSNKADKHCDYFRSWLIAKQVRREREEALWRLHRDMCEQEEQLGTDSEVDSFDSEDDEYPSDIEAQELVWFIDQGNSSGSEDEESATE